MKIHDAVALPLHVSTKLAEGEAMLTIEELASILSLCRTPTRRAIPMAAAGALRQDCGTC
jgi:hypothetical protein